MRILEPACGSGNLIRPLLSGGHRARDITAIELDEGWANHCRARFDNEVVVKVCGDFLSDDWGRFDAVVMNPPFENGLHAAFLEHAFTITSLSNLARQ